jgi:hypothetical protein
MAAEKQTEKMLLKETMTKVTEEQDVNGNIGIEKEA